MLNEYTVATAATELVRLLVTSYLTVAIMAVGLATMLAGGSGASAAARFFFLRPQQMLLGGVLTFLTLMLGSTWTGFVSLVSMLARALRGELKELAADLRWVVRRFDR